MRTAFLGLLFFLATMPWNAVVPDAPAGAAILQDDPKDKPAPKRRPTFTIGKETTFVDGPIDKDGRIDYATALNKKLSQGVTPQNNAVVLLWRAHGPKPEGAPMPAQFYTWLGIEAPPDKGDYFIDMGKFFKEEFKIDPNKEGETIWDLSQKATDKPWTPKDYPKFAAWLKANEKPLALVVEASKRPHYFSPLVPSDIDGSPGGLIAALLPGVQRCRTFAQALTMRAMLKLGQGDHDGAWQDLLAVHRLGRLVARGGTLIEGLVGIAIEAIASKAEITYLDRAKPSIKQLDACLIDLKKLPPMPPMAEKMDLAERFMYLDIVMMLDKRGLKYLDLVAGLAGDGTKSATAALNGVIDILVGQVDWDPAMRNGNVFFDRMKAAMLAKDRATREKEFAKIETDVKLLKVKSGDWTNVVLLLARGKEGAQAKGKVIGDVLVSLLLPAMHKVQNAYDRSQQVQDNLQLAFILAKYHRDNGRYPEKLDALAPKYLEKVPQDSFSGKPLVYRVTETGYFFYSVGINGKDEEGRTYGDNPPGDDLGVRMPPR